jgi:hypothetical protein
MLIAMNLINIVKKVITSVLGRYGPQIFNLFREIVIAEDTLVIVGSWARASREEVITENIREKPLILGDNDDEELALKALPTVKRAVYKVLVILSRHLLLERYGR